MAAKLDRRGFLSASSTLLAGAGGFWTSSSEAEPKSAMEKLRLGVVGVGNHGFTNLHAVLQEDVVAICDVDANMLKVAASVARSAKNYRDYRELIQHPDLDGLVVSLPDHNHATCAIRGMQQGLHVYCEKPLTHNMQELADLLAVAEKSRVATQTGVQHHSKEGYRRAAEILQAGTLGAVREVHAWTNRPIWPQGQKRPVEQRPIPAHLSWDFWLGAAPARPYHEAYHPMAWRGRWDFGGGALADLGPHLLDPVVWGLDLADPVRIVARSSEVTRESPPLWSIVEFDFPAARSQPAFRLTWYDGSKQPPRELTRIERLPPNGVLVFAERGRLFIPMLGRQPRILANPGGTVPRPPKPFLPKVAGHHQQWLSACRGRGKTSCDFHYGARLTRICHLGNLAIRTGKPVQWDPRKRQLVASPLAQPLLKRSPRAGWHYTA